MKVPAMDIGQNELPAGWRWAKLADVCQINPKRPSMDWKPGTKTNFVPMSGVDAQTGEIIQLGVKDYSEISRGYTYFEEGDVLFAKITPCMQNGKHAVASSLLNGFAFGSTEFHVLRPNEQIIPGWIHKFLRQPTTWQKLSRYFRGAVGQQRVPKKFLGELPIPIPPLEEQRRIARILNEQMVAVEEAKKAAQQQLDTVHALPTAYLRKVFPSSEDELPAGWKWVKMGDVLALLETGSRPKGGALAEDTGVFSISAEHMTSSGSINLSVGRYIPKEWFDAMKAGKIIYGDVLVVKDGATTGKTAYVDKSVAGHLVAINEHVFLCRSDADAINSKYLFYYLWGSEGQAQIRKNYRGSAIGGINRGFADAIYIPLPSLEEQRRITSELDGKIAKVKLIEASVQQQLDTIYALPATLLRKAFSGEI